VQVNGLPLTRWVRECYIITPPWIKLFGYLIALELDFIADNLTKSEANAWAMLMFHHPHAFPTVRTCTLRFSVLRRNPLRSLDTLYVFAKEFSTVFPCLTQLSIRGPVMLAELKLMLLTHLTLENVDPQHGLFLPRLESLHFCMHDVPKRFFGGIGMKLSASNDENVWKEAMHQKLGVESDYDKFRVALNISMEGDSGGI
jgi:hypothetical protein